MVSKPKIWKRKGKLTKNAKKYLSFKLKAYWSGKKRVEFREKRTRIKGDTKIRISAKLVYTETNPIWVEAYIEGFYSQANQMKTELLRVINRNFSSGIADEIETGFEEQPKILKNFSKTMMAVRYKSSIGSPWRYL